METPLSLDKIGMKNEKQSIRRKSKRFSKIKNTKNLPNIHVFSIMRNTNIMLSNKLRARHNKKYDRSTKINTMN